MSTTPETAPTAPTAPTAAPARHMQKTISISVDEIKAMEIFIARNKGKNGGPKNFSDAVQKGLRAILSQADTSVSAILANA